MWECPRACLHTQAARGDEAVCVLDFVGEQLLQKYIILCHMWWHSAVLICTICSSCSFTWWKIVKFRKVTDIILSMFSRIENRIDSTWYAVGWATFEYSSPSSWWFGVSDSSMWVAVLCTTRSFSSLSLPSVCLTRHYLVCILFNICEILFSSLHIWVICASPCPCPVTGWYIVIES